MFPFIKFPGVDTVLGPEMKSTGEVMGVGRSFAEAFVKSQLAAGDRLPTIGKVLLSVRDSDKNGVLEVARELQRLGFGVCATRGTAKSLLDAGVVVQRVNKVNEGRPHIGDMIKNGQIALVVNTVAEQWQAKQDSYSIRRAALQARIPLHTTLAGAKAVCLGLAQAPNFEVYSVQELHASLKGLNS